MKPESKEKLVKYNESKGYGISDDDLIETIIECGQTIWQGKGDRHRWYTLIPTVVKVGDVYFQYDRCDVHGEEANVEDCIGGYKLDDMFEVKPVTQTVIGYIEI